jgi:hypothetical protein
MHLMMVMGAEQNAVVGGGASVSEPTRSTFVIFFRVAFAT